MRTSMTIFFSLHYYPVLTLQFPTALKSHHLSTPSWNSEMLAPITTPNHLPFFIQVSYLKLLVHHTIFSFSLSFNHLPKQFLPSSSPAKFLPLTISLIPPGSPASKQLPNQNRNHSLQQKRSWKLSRTGQEEKVSRNAQPAWKQVCKTPERPWGFNTEE